MLDEIVEYVKVLQQKIKVGIVSLLSMKKIIEGKVVLTL